MRKLLIGFFWFLTISIYAQENEVTIDYTNTPLEQVLQEIEKTFDLRISFQSEVVSDKTITLTGTFSLQEIISRLEQQTNLSLSRLDNTNYVLKRNREGLLDITGTLIDATTNEPISFATIRIKDAPRGVITDAEGLFVLKDVPGDAVIVIEHIGYAKIERPATDFSLQGTSILISPSAAFIGEVVLTEYITRGFDRNNQDGSVALRPDKLGILPGLTEPDVLQSLQLLPGISSPAESASGLHIRGGTPDQNLVLWDGIKMYHQGHFFGEISAFNPYITKNVNVYRSGTSAQYGDRISGVIDITSLDDIPERIKVGGGSNLTHADANVQIPLFDNTVGLVLSGRRSFADIFETVTFRNLNRKVFQNTKIDDGVTNLDEEFRELENFFRFTDFNTKLLWKPSEKDRISLSALFVTNTFEFEVESTEAKDEDNLDLVNNGYSLNWEHKASDHWNWVLNAYYSTFESDFSFREFEPSENEDFLLAKKNNVDDIGVSLRTTYRFNDNHSLSGGYDFFNNQVFYTISTTENGQGVISELEDDNLNSHSIYSEYEYSSDHLFFRGGLRVAHLSSDQTLYWEPRAYVESPLTDDLKIKASGEIKNQAISQLVLFDFNDIGVGNNIWVLADDDDIPVLNNRQITAGFLFEDNGWNIDVEGYYRNIRGLTSFSRGFNNAAGNIDDYEDGTGDTFGLDILLKKRIKNYRFWASYSLSKTDFEFENLQEGKFPGNFDQRHVLTLSNTFSWNRFQFSLGWTLATGKPFSQPTGIETIIDDGDDVNFEPIFGDQNNARLDNYHRLDASVVYDFPLGKRQQTNARIGVSVLNIYDHENPLDKIFRVVSESNGDETTPRIIEETRLGLGMTPNVVFRINF